LSRKADPWEDIEDYACSLRRAREKLDDILRSGEIK